MISYQASDLVPLLNDYRIGLGPPKTVVIPNASRLVHLRDVTINGTLLKKQVILLDPKTNSRTVKLTVSQGVHGIEQDGDLHFEMEGKDENYVRAAGLVSDVQLNLVSSLPASFTFDSTDIGYPIQVYAMHGTTAARQLRQLKKAQVSLIALRNVDLEQALKGRYVINLLAIDLQG